MNEHLMDIISNSSSSNVAMEGAIMTKALLDILYAASGRSDESTMLHLCDLCPPERLEHVGPCDAFKYQMLLYQMKQATSGKADYMHMMAHADVVHCPVNALITHIHYIFGVKRAKFPDPLNAYDTEW
jgi:hypothetical protein